VDRLFDWSGRLSAFLALLAKLVVGLIVVLVAADVLARNVSRSLVWSVSLVEYLMIYMTFLAMPALVRAKAHVCADFIRMSLPPGLQSVVEKLVYVLCLALSAYLALVATRVFIETWQNGSYDVRNFDMPRWLIFLPMVLGLWLSCIEFLRYLLGRDSIYAIAAADRESL